MHAHLHSTRLAPKKANIMAKMVRGMPVPDAMELLRRTTKKSARLFEQLLRSAIANAEHNFKQDAQRMILKTVVVNQGTAYRRGIPMARGRVRPIRKFMCHITLTLGFEGMETVKGDSKSKNQEAHSKKEGTETTSQAKKKTVKTANSTKPRASKKSPAPHSAEREVGSDSSTSSSSK